ncbi:uncharacterized protein LACBIDRAFT_311640 [Laccaria bicolor S238N-H82]|uniref:Long chronological lifespan protein 2 n=1 Tax=Laccaria bicolor (strain S238N-H82 / ATCC MYA-4686) TaxID=486041 RepID=B0CXW9_LACBS|nr:uncharacterized protein LACBIDRAFT_311640 [Laccaria bicolor S238N-H82]EDR12339.1 predicted protein [Laccaria bicolor S238N-H82]|eukprot:XP_001876603.1 predicted protein [Laccaria bicolor S238N-H82]
MYQFTIYHVVEHVDQLLQLLCLISSMHMFRVSLSLVLLLFFGTVSAQFNFFENMFGHGQQQQQQQQQQRSGASQWAAFSDSVSCSHYLCPTTLDCVRRPVDCPCPDIQDVKCIIPDMEGDVEDATVVCTRGQNDCVEVEKLMRNRKL